MAIVGSANVQKNNKYYLQTNSKINNINKLVSDVAQLFYLQPTEQLETSNIIINIFEQSNELSLTVISDKFSPQKQIIFVSENGTFNTNILKKHLLLILKNIYKDGMLDWGVLRGVRPIKLVQNFFEKGLQIDEIYNLLRNDFLLSEQKANLALQVASHQNILASSYRQKDIAIYIGIPFCSTKCTYCSFPSSIIPTNDQDLDLFFQAIELDIQNVLQLANDYKLNVRSLYIGGGTPTCLPEKYFAYLADIIAKLLKNFNIEEFTFEAGRVDSLTKNKLSILNNLGITRVSLNPQTFNEKTLLKVERNHTAKSFCDWYEYVRQQYSWKINTDIILGLPDETIHDVQNTMEKLCLYKPDNLTIHTLAFKKQAELFNNLELYYQHSKQIKDMMQVATDMASGMGMIPYYLYRQRYILGNMENIGYSIPRTECMYNLIIMQEKNTILGIGPSATTKIIDKNGNLTTFFMPKNVSIYNSLIHDYIEKRTNIFKEIFNNNSSV